MVLRRMAQAVLVVLVLGVTAGAEEKVSAVLKGVSGLRDKEAKALVSKLESIGYENVNNNENIQDAYFEKYHEQSLDYLSFFTVTNEKVMRELLLAYPRYGAFSPFNLLVYKSQNEDKTWFGKFDAQPILDMIGDTDPQRVATYKKMQADLDALIDSEIKPTDTLKVPYTALSKKPLLEMVKTIERPKDFSDFMDDFGEVHDEAFEDAEFIIAGFLDFKEAYTDAKLPFDRYDAYWISSLCHFTFSNAIFNHGDPQAGIFAPCTVYFYVEKGSNKLHMGMATVENWITMSGVSDPAKIKMMKDIDKEIVKVFEKLGFVMEGTEGSAAAPVATGAKKAVEVSTIKHGEKYEVGKVLKSTPTYLVAAASTVEEVQTKLKANGFEILATTPVLKDETVLSITNEALKANNGFASVINVLVNSAAHEVRVQNPDYLSRAYLGSKYKTGMLDSTIAALESALGTLSASEESMETGDIAGYHFMMGMPYFDDAIVLASGAGLAEKAKRSDAVAYTVALPNGATLVGHVLGKRTSRFLKKIAVTQNAAMLPYAVLIQGDEAKMLDPKYYLALSLPQLSMGEFMKIATIPDSIKKELGKVYK